VSRKHKPQAELTEKERKLRVRLLIIGVAALAAGIAVFFLVR
jgi:hypothetical protein